MCLPQKTISNTTPFLFSPLPYHYVCAHACTKACAHIHMHIYAYLYSLIWLKSSLQNAHCETGLALTLIKIDLAKLRGSKCWYVMQSTLSASYYLLGYLSYQQDPHAAFGYLEPFFNPFAHTRTKSELVLPPSSYVHGSYFHKIVLSPTYLSRNVMTKEYTLDWKSE